MNLITYAVKHKDSSVRANSRSGGIFTALSDKILEENGVVYGCVLTEDFQIIHVRATTKEKRDRMRGSKYVQSHMDDIYSRVKSDLESGKRVLFSGTPCQVAGLKGYLGKEYVSLLYVDIVCHGVPSPKVWRDYISWQEEKHGKIKNVDFRNKRKYGWAEHVETLQLQSGRKVNSRVFTTLFYGHNVLRPSCYECPFKSTMRTSDITIADYWGIDKAAPGFNDNKGVSLVLINSDSGLELFNAIKENIVWRETNIEDSMQPPLVGPFKKPNGREQFWEEYSEKCFADIAVKYGGLSIKGKFRNMKKSLQKKKKVLLKRM